MATIYGTADDDRLEGTDSADELIGGYGNDVLVGGSGDDVLWGWLQNALEERDQGFDTAVFHSTLDQAQIGFDQITALTVSSPDGRDLLHAIERVIFDDGDFLVSGSLYTTFTAYATFMDRSPTVAEFAFWNPVGGPAGSNEINRAIIRSGEGAALFRDNVADTYRIYGGRDPVASEQEFWRDRYYSGVLPTFENLRSTILRDPLGRDHMTAVLNADYQQYFGRAPTDAEVSRWFSLFNHFDNYGGGLLPDRAFATPDGLIATLMQDASSTGHVLQLSGTEAAETFALPADFTNVTIQNFDWQADTLSFAGTPYAGIDPRDPARADTAGDWQAATGGVLITLDDTHHILLEGRYSPENREQYLSQSYNRIDTYYEKYFGRAPLSTEDYNWTRIFADGGTYDTLTDTLLRDRGAVATGVRQIAATPAADTIAFSGAFGEAVVNGFDPATDRLSLHDTPYAGVDALDAAHARAITGLDGAHDVLLSFAPDDAILLHNVLLGDLSAFNFVM